MNQSIENKITTHLCNCKNHNLDENFTFYDYSQGFLVSVGHACYRVQTSGNKINLVKQIPRNKFNQLKATS